MKATRTLLGAAALAMICVTSSVTAQTESREQVKAETKSANKAGAIPHGEVPTQQAPMKSSKTRADRKAETKAAKASGDVSRGGEASPTDGKIKTSGEARKRSDVKAETAQAIKAGKTPSGEK